MIDMEFEWPVIGLITDALSACFLFRAGVLGLDNLDFAASTFDLARYHGSVTSQRHDDVIANEEHPPVAPPRRPTVDDGGMGRLRASGLFGLHSPHHSGQRPQHPHRTGHRRLSINLSQHDLRKMIEIMNAGRR